MLSPQKYGLHSKIDVFRLVVGGVARVKVLLRVVACVSDRLSLCGCSGAIQSIRGIIEICL